MESQPQNPEFRINPENITYEYTIFDLNNFMCTISKLECAVDGAP